MADVDKMTETMACGAAVQTLQRGLLVVVVEAS